MRHFPVTAVVPHESFFYLTERSRNEQRPLLAPVVEDLQGVRSVGERIFELEMESNEHWNHALGMVFLSVIGGVCIHAYGILGLPVAGPPTVFAFLQAIDRFGAADVCQGLKDIEKAKLAGAVGKEFVDELGESRYFFSSNSQINNEQVQEALDQLVSQFQTLRLASSSRESNETETVV